MFPATAPLQPGGLIGFVTVIFLLIAIALVYSSVVIIRPYQKGAYTVLGTYRGVLDQGIHFIYPFVSDVTRFDMRTQTLDVPRQEAITRDNSPVTADAVVYIKVMDPKKAFLEVDNYERAVSNLAQTTLRAVLGDMELDDTLNKRGEINARIRKELDEPTDEWGVRVESVEVREVNPSKDVQQAMEQQTSAERKRRAMILEAQGERRSAIETAEGDKQSNIIRAQGEKQSQILEAQGDAISTVLRAKSAESMGERAVIDKGMETLAEIGQGESTKFILPQELTSLVGRYGKHLQGSDVKENGHALEALDFDDETREMLGLDDIEEILGQIDEEAQVDVEAMEEEAQKIKEGQDSGLDSADEMIQEMDAEIDDDSGTTDVAGGPDDTTRTSEVDKDD
ncbi:SPFH domain-containing protein [Haloarcula sp. KBTZ06]|uniref:SPFH/Band 7/PHB domain protein n=1 Tax=Haloarcula hispanica TaxID=51589 RepID=A0A482T580_HALHI|nr:MULTISPECIES: SPFH domain-containing protein [Haloarcula]AJF24972.1 phosphoesterase [Haloarcula sp. CBA1115]KAA9406405.1 SPFH/Band 7/PHB domain protein [Haloarcula sp. CBA1131]KZX47546.1 phosphoesterase [Haloarcula sp. K1]MCJ0619649.1 SPFH/Band 7/PHB domain protein [Haloarcula hispanica]MUV50821.1 phosphoesterase [Haloarcula sp. CBA1122]